MNSDPREFYTRDRFPLNVSAVRSFDTLQQRLHANVDAQGTVSVLYRGEYSISDYDHNPIHRIKAL